MSNIGLILDHHLQLDDKIGRYKCKNCKVEFNEELDSQYASHICFSQTDEIVIGIGELIAIIDRK